MVYKCNDILSTLVPSPSLTTGLTDQSFQYNSNITLLCTFNSLTVPHITWTTNAVSSVLTPQSTISNSNTHTSMLILYNVNLSNAGMYTCTATNEGGQISSVATLTVTGNSITCH